MRRMKGKMRKRGEEKKPNQVTKKKKKKRKIKIDDKG